jgi:hypothetical protein
LLLKKKKKFFFLKREKNNAAAFSAKSWPCTHLPLSTIFFLSSDICLSVCLSVCLSARLSAAAGYLCQTSTFLLGCPEWGADTVKCV